MCRKMLSFGAPSLRGGVRRFWLVPLVQPLACCLCGASVELAHARGSTRSPSQPSAAPIPRPLVRLARATVEPQPYRPPLVVLLARAPRHAWATAQLAPNGCLRSRASLLVLISSSSSVPAGWPAHTMPFLLTRRSRSHVVRMALRGTAAYRPGLGRSRPPSRSSSKPLPSMTCEVLTRATQVSSICRYIAAPILSSGGVATLACSVVASRP